MNDYIYTRFDKPLLELEKLLSASRSKKDPGLFLYQSGARTIAFQLEALCRIYRKTLKSKTIDTWRKTFKGLEDLMGSMDHNESMNNEFSGYPSLKKHAQRIHGDRFTEETGFLSDYLREQGWLAANPFGTFRETLRNLPYLTPEDDRKATIAFLVRETGKIESDYQQGIINPEDIENGIHAFRRKLRWLSIYAIVLDGQIKLRPSAPMQAALARYCTKEIMALPFNKLPKTPSKLHPIQISSPLFFSMSWLINHLGEIKDIGIRHHAFTEIWNSMPENGRSKEVKLKFLSTLSMPPDSLPAVADLAMDEFLRTDAIMMRVRIELLRSMHPVSTMNG